MQQLATGFGRFVIGYRDSLNMAFTDPLWNLWSYQIRPSDPAEAGLARVAAGYPRHVERVLPLKLILPFDHVRLRGPE